MSSYTTVFKDANVLVVGGAGFVGSNLVQQILACGAEQVHVVDNLLSAERENLPDDPRVLFTEASITEDWVLNQFEDSFDYIFQLATYHGNQSSIHDPLADHANNTLPTLKLLERVKHFQRLKKMVYSGAGCCIAEKTFESAQATVESELISLKNMDSPYAMSKIFGEFYCNYYFKQHGVPTVRARFQNVYGPGEVLGAGQWRGTPATVWRNVTPTFIYKSIHGEALPVENGGIASRDFIYVDDIALGLMACAANGTPGDVYNLASGVESTILEWAQLINELVGNQTPIAYEPKRDWDRSGKRFGSTEKAERELGFSVQTDAKNGLQKTIQWTRDNLPWIERCIAQHAEQLAAVHPKKDVVSV
jgi:nucleoside-diphosphate-sugar epimerase